jgi:hypothetical protein
MAWNLRERWWRQAIALSSSILASGVAACSGDGRATHAAAAPAVEGDAAGDGSSSGASNIGAAGAGASDGVPHEDLMTAPTSSASGSEGLPNVPASDNGSARPDGETAPDAPPMLEPSPVDAQTSPQPSFNPALLAQGVRWLGRVDISDPEEPRFAWSETGFVARFEGTALNVDLDNDDAFVFKIVIDGAPQPPFAARQGLASYTLAQGLTPDVHVVELLRQTEAVHGISRFVKVETPGGTLLEPPPARDRLIEVVGASVSAGFGDLRDDPCGYSFATQSSFDAFPAVASRELGADLMLLAISGRGVTRNDTGSTAGTMPQLFDRILPDDPSLEWSFRATPQAVVVNLGKNDFAVGDPGSALVDGYVTFSRELRQRYPEALIVIATGPNLGPDHALQIGYARQAIALRQADGDNDIELLDWDELSPGEIGCAYHPNQIKQREMGQQLAEAIRLRLGW